MENTGVLELKWVTQPIPYKEPKYGQLELLVSGICRYKVNNNSIPREHLEQALYQNIMDCIQKVISDNPNQDYNRIGNIVKNNITSTLTASIQTNNITIENINIDIRLSNLSDSSSREVAEMERNKVTVVKTDEDEKNEQNKCPQCGSTDIALNVNTGHLRCNFCRHEFESQKFDSLEKDISKLRGEVIASGASNIIADANDVLTLKCTSCGAEVVIDTASATQARCHWCRSSLSLNQQIPNGAIPDTVLPFLVTKDDAKDAIEKFVGKRKFFAHPKFRQEFTTENVMGVYFPYMIVDANIHTKLVGQGEHETGRYTVKKGDRTEIYYDADLYEVEREFDLTIEGLTIESSKDKLDTSRSDKTTNIINSIMPFDTENCVKWDANYIKGYTSERRDTNVEELKKIVYAQSGNIAKAAANKTIANYDRGVRWDNQQLTIKGQQWKAAYLPVWIYSYREEKGENSLLHYVAVNARTVETMGSVPIHMPKLLFVSFLVGFLGVFFMGFHGGYNEYLVLSHLLTSFVFFLIIYSRYRNKGARHKYATETKNNMTNIVKKDAFIKSKKGLSNARMEGANIDTALGHGGKVLISFTKRN